MASPKYWSNSPRQRLGFFDLNKLIWKNLSIRRKRQSIFLIFLMIVSGASEIISLGAIIPFLAALTAPEKLFEITMVKKIAIFFNLLEPRLLVFPLAAIFIIAATMSGFIRTIILWLNNRFSVAISTDFSSEIFKRTIYQPYIRHISINSSVILSGITQKAGSLTSILLSILTLISSIILTISNLGFMIYINSKVILIAGACFGAFYFCMGYITKNKLLKNSETFARNQTKVINIIQECLGGIRDVILAKNQKIYCDYYDLADRDMRYAQASSQFIAGVPRILMETLGIVTFSLIAYYLNGTPGGINQSLPLLAAFAFGAQRLLPAFQQLYGAWANITGSQVPVIEACELLDQPIPIQHFRTSKPVNFSETIELQKIGFRYSKDSIWILNDVSLKINKGDRVGIIGSTGSGKSTLLDVLMGLLEPEVGKILVDGIELKKENISGWQRNIAHVPQNIFLSDTNIAENIAFGVPKDKIDYDLLESSAVDAMLIDLINKLPNSFDTPVGERGIRLSGGERQRIGIARALYKKASILIFDEATSSLDNRTEKNIIDSIDNLNSQITIFIIAHRLSTIKNCNLILEIDNGYTKIYKNYENMLNTYPNAKV